MVLTLLRISVTLTYAYAQKYLIFCRGSHSAAGSCLTLVKIQNLEVPLPTSPEGLDLVGNLRACIMHTGRIS